jgi:hypothetical protein
MTQQYYENKDFIDKWRKVAEALAIAGKTNSPFYRRAMIIIRTGKDPEQ